MTPVAVVLLPLLAVCIGVAVAGSGDLQFLAAVLAIVILAVLAGGGRAAPAAKTAIYRRGKTITHVEAEVLDEAPVDESAWTRERERREAEEGRRMPETGL